MSDNLYRNEKEKKILTSALTAYMKYGISEATTRQISDIAGVGKSTIFEYFKDKDELITKAFSYFLLEMAEGRKSIREIAKENPVLALATYIDGTIHLALHEPEKLLLLTQYIVQIFVGTSGVQSVKDEYHKKFFPSMQALVDELGGIIEKGIETGRIKPVIGLSIDKVTYTVLALIREIQAQAFIQEDAELRKTCRTIKETIFAILGIEESGIRIQDSAEGKKV
jgi:AcrR family transcriptional regulator